MEDVLTSFCMLQNKINKETKSYKGNVIITDITTKTTKKFIEDEDEFIDIVDSVEFTVLYKKLQYFVECYFTGDHDTYCVRMYNNTESATIGDETEVWSTFIDSCGGGFAEMEDMSVEESLEDVTNAVTEFLFGNDGVIIPF